MSEESNFHEDTWSANDEMFNCDSLNELLNENDNLAVGDIVWKGEKFPVKIAAYVDAGDIIEMLGERAYDEVGAVAAHRRDAVSAATPESAAFTSAIALSRQNSVKNFAIYNHLLPPRAAWSNTSWQIEARLRSGQSGRASFAPARHTATDDLEEETGVKNRGVTQISRT